MGSNINDPYYYWTDTRPTEEGNWYFRNKIAKGQGQVVLVREFETVKGKQLCYFDVDCGWKRINELSIEYWEWSSKPVPFPMEE